MLSDAVWLSRLPPSWLPGDTPQTQLPFREETQTAQGSAAVWTGGRAQVCWPTVQLATQSPHGQHQHLDMSDGVADDSGPERASRPHPETPDPRPWRPWC